LTPSQFASFRAKREIFRPVTEISQAFSMFLKFSPVVEIETEMTTQFIDGAQYKLKFQQINLTP